MAAPALAIQGLTAATGALQRSLANANSQLTRTQTSLAGFAKGAEDAIPLLGTLAAQVTQAAAAMAELDRRSQALDVPAAQLHQFAQVASTIAGLSFDRSFNALQTFAERVGEAYTDTGSEIANTFRRLGVAVEDSDGGVRRATDVWTDFIAALVPLDASVRNFEAAKFGDVVRDLAVPLANAGPAAARLGDELQRVAALDSGLADAAAESNETYGLLGASWDALTGNIANWVTQLGVVEGTAEIATGAIGAVNRTLFDTPIVDADGLQEATERRAKAAADLKALEAESGGNRNERAARAAAIRALEEEIALIDERTASYEKGAKQRNQDGESAGDRQVLATVQEIIAAEKRRAAELDAVNEKLREQRELNEDPALIAALTARRDALLPRDADAEELDRATLARETVGLSAREVELAGLRLRLEKAVDAVAKAHIEKLIEEATIKHNNLDAAAEQLTVDSALASLRSQIVAIEGDERDILLAQLGITQDMLDANEELAAAVETVLRLTADEDSKTGIEAIRAEIRALTGDERSLREVLLDKHNLTEEMLENDKERSAEFEKLLTAAEKTADEARQEAIFGELNRALAEQTAEADGKDLRIHQLIVAAKALGYEITEKELAALRKGFSDLDAGNEKTQIQKELKDAANQGLKDGFRQFVDGGDIGDIFDEIGRRLRDTILNRALDNLFDYLLDDLLIPFFKGFGKRAGGGPVSPGNFYLVGEEGPELFAPRLPGAIIPNGMAFGGGSQTIAPVVHISGTVRSDADIQAIADRAAERSAAAVARAVRSGRLTEAA